MPKIGVDTAENVSDFCLLFPLLLTVSGESPLPSDYGDTAEIRYSIYIYLSIYPSFDLSRIFLVVRFFCVSSLEEILGFRSQTSIPKSSAA